MPFLQPGSSSATGAILRLALAVVACIVITSILVLLAGPLLLFMLLALAAAIVWLARRAFQSGPGSVGILAAFRLLCILLRNLPKLGNALTLAADGMQAAASGIAAGRDALRRTESDLGGAGTVLKTVTFPVPSPERRSLREMLNVPGDLGISVADEKLVVGLSFEQKKVLEALGDLMIRQASDIRSVSAVMQNHIDVLNGAAQPLRELGQALKTAS